MRKTVFVSYATADEQYAQALKIWLESCFPKGFVEVFIASNWESIPMGSEWFDEIINAMQRCKVAIVLASRNALRSRWVYMEAGALKIIGRNVVPVCVGSVEASDLPPILERKQACRYDNAGDRWKLVRTISTDVEMPQEFTEDIPRSAAERAPEIRPVENTDATDYTGHGIALERLFHTDDRWTTVVYTCRATFTKETCPGDVTQLGKTISPHLPVDEVQTFCAAVNHLMAINVRKQEEDIVQTVICSKEAERLAREFPVIPIDPSAPPPLLDRDLIVIGENNFSNLLLFMAEPFQPWTARQHDEIPGDDKRRAMIYAERTQHARLDAEPKQNNRVGNGGGLISIFPSPFNFRKNVINFYGCHRDGQVTLENWMRGFEVEKVVDMIAAVRAADDPRLYSTQIVVNSDGPPNRGHFVDPLRSSGAIPNIREGRPFWLTRVNAFPPPEGIEVNDHCRAEGPMYDISLIVELNEETQSCLAEQMRTHVPAPEIYSENEHCNIRFHITLYEFCTHDRPSPQELEQLEAAFTLLRSTLHDEGVPEARPGQVQLRGFDLTHAALISYVDFLPTHRKEENWLEHVRTWCDAAVQRMLGKIDVPRLFNKRRVPFPPHVTLCRFAEPVSPELAQRIRDVTTSRRHAVLSPIEIDSLSLATATQRPYQKVDVRERFALRKP